MRSSKITLGGLVIIIINIDMTNTPRLTPPQH